MTEQLLDEYLKVINAKDGEISRLIREKETLQYDMKRREDKYRTKLVALKQEVELIHAKHREDDGEQSIRLTKENSALKSDVMTLQEALRRSDEQLQVVLKTNGKAQRHESHAREKMEQEFRTIRSSLEDKLFETLQRCGQLEALLNSGGQKFTDAEKELARWKVEARRLQHDYEDQHRLIKELKKRTREMVPKEVVMAETAQVEEHHRTMIATVEKECLRIRDQLREESNKGSRCDLALQDAKKKVEDLTHELSLARRQFEEMEVAYTQAKLHHTSTIEDIKKEYTFDVRSLRDQLERERYSRASIEGELVVVKQRLLEAETVHSNSLATNNKEITARTEEVAALRLRSQESQAECETLRRNIASTEESLVSVKAKFAQLRNDADIEIARLKTEIAHSDEVIRKREADISQLQRVSEDLRAVVSTLQQDLGNERTQLMRKENDWRSKLLSLDEQLRAKEEEKRNVAEALEDQLRERELQYQNERSARQRETQKQQFSTSAQVAELQERLTASESRYTELKQEHTMAKEECAVRAEKERSLAATIAQLDDRVVRLQMEVSERDASINTLRRNLDQVSQALRTVQQESEAANATVSKHQATIVSLEQRVEKLRDVIQERDDAVVVLQTANKRMEHLSTETASELQSELTTARDRVRQLSNELSTAQQQCSVLKVEMSRAERERTDEHTSLQRDVLQPLQGKVDSLISNNQRLSRESMEKDDRISDLTKQINRLSESILFHQSECAAKDRKIMQLSEDVEDSSTQLVTLRRTQQQLNAAQDETRRSKADTELLLEKIANLETLLQSKIDEINRLHDKEIDLLTEVNNRKSEIATIRERYANLESLKNIADQSILEMQSRERDLTEKLEELRSAQQMMQMCFDKQQEQLELGRRLRDGGNQSENGSFRR